MSLVRVVVKNLRGCGGKEMSPTFGGEQRRFFKLANSVRRGLAPS